MATTPAVPFGLRHLISPPASMSGLPSMTYSDALQLNVSSTGNPWHAEAGVVAETQTETNQDGNGPGSDNGTDVY